MGIEAPAIEQFAQTWAKEFAAAVAMFAGECAPIRCTRSPTVADPLPNDYLWVEQSFADGGTFGTIIGASEQTWRLLGQALGEETAEGLRSTYLEIANQAQKSTATTLNNSLQKTLECGELKTTDNPAIDAEGYFVFEVEIVGSGTPALVLAIASSAAEVLCSEDSSVPEFGSPDEHPVPGDGNLPDVNFPASVCLGRKQLKLRTVLGCSAGSVITTSTKIGDPGELLVNGKIVARGELVLVGSSYGFRVTQILGNQS